MISSASVRLALDFCSLGTWLGIQVLLGCQETLSMSVLTWSQRCFCLMLRLGALRKLLPISQKAAQLWVLTRQPQVGVGNGKLVPHWGVEDHLALGPCSSSFSFCLWPSDCWGQAGEQNLGRWWEEERRRVTGWEWTQTLHLGSLLRPVRLGAKITVLLPAGVQSESVREEESIAIQIKACFSRKVCWVRTGVSVAACHLLCPSLHPSPLVLGGWRRGCGTGAQGRALHCGS